jgi:hypothetical protein
MSNNGTFASIQAPITVVHSNLDQEIIQITEDKLRLVLNEHLYQIEEKKSWVTPFSILIAVVTTFCTSDFHEAYFKAETWKAFFLLIGIISFVFLFKSGWKAINSPNIDDLVHKVKNKSTN